MIGNFSETCKRWMCLVCSMETFLCSLRWNRRLKAAWDKSQQPSLQTRPRLLHPTFHFDRGGFSSKIRRTCLQQSRKKTSWRRRRCLKEKLGNKIWKWETGEEKNSFIFCYKNCFRWLFFILKRTLTFYRQTFFNSVLEVLWKVTILTEYQKWINVQVESHPVKKVDASAY